MWVRKLQLPTIAVVCATYNGEEKLIGLLRALEENLQNSKVDSEIIFVIDGSIDKSIDYLQNFAKIHPNKKIKVTQNSVNLGISESRNIGITTSDSEIIAFLDDDCRPNPYWLNSLAINWHEASKETVGIGGFVIPNEKISFNQEFCALVMPLRPMPLKSKKQDFFQRIKKYYSVPKKNNEYAEYLVGANMSFRKLALLEVGLFSRRIRFGGDDSDICKKLRNRYGNGCLRALSNLEMNHEFSRNFKDSLRRSYRYGLGAGKNFLLNQGGFSFNPGPGLIIGLLFLFVIVTLMTGNSKQQVLAYSFAFLILETFFYSSLVIQSKVKLPIPFQKRIKFGLAFLMCEIANTLGFMAGLRFVFSSRI